MKADAFDLLSRRASARKCSQTQYLRLLIREAMARSGELDQSRTRGQ
jgi:hypothetical protein